jgi:GT2 family glycosyltransferase
MTLIAMAVYSTSENEKDDCLEQTLQSLKQSVDFGRHRLMLSVNSLTSATEDIINEYEGVINKVIYNSTNIGTAEAINKAWAHRAAGENAVKMDDDVVIVNNTTWVDEMDEAIKRAPGIGVIGLKRKDLIQNPWHPDPHYKSEMVMLSHKLGERWIVVERTADIIGTCTMYSSALLDKIGYLKQLGLYGYDDNISCHRAHLAGFYNCFLNHIEIEHVDKGGNDYAEWKHSHSGEFTPLFVDYVHGLISGKNSIYYNPFVK